MDIFEWTNNTSMKIGVLKYPGGHGDTELIHILGDHFNMDVREIWYREEAYADIDLLFIGGGFPCKNTVPGKSCLDESPALNFLPEFAKNGGAIVGVGNGFRFLSEAGLLPGELQQNSGEKFICRQVYLKPENHVSHMTSGLDPEGIYRAPIATAYGNYRADDDTLVRMRQEGQILFRYCDYEGRITEAVNFTGATDNIAGVCNREKNVFGLIPQPERAVSEFGSKADGNIILGAFLGELTK